MIPTFPSGDHVSSITCFALSEGNICPGSWRLIPAARSHMSIYSWTSPFPSTRIFPISSEISIPISSFRGDFSPQQRNREQSYLLLPECVAHLSYNISTSRCWCFSPITLRLFHILDTSMIVLDACHAHFSQWFVEAGIVRRVDGSCPQYQSYEHVWIVHRFHTTSRHQSNHRWSRWERAFSGDLSQLEKWNCVGGTCFFSPVGQCAGFSLRPTEIFESFFTNHSIFPFDGHPLPRSFPSYPTLKNEKRVKKKGKNVLFFSHSLFFLTQFWSSCSSLFVPIYFKN